jgi:hypothetical protein
MQSWQICFSSELLRNTHQRITVKQAQDITMLMTATVYRWYLKRLQVSPQHFLKVTTALYSHILYNAHKTHTTQRCVFVLSKKWLYDGCVYIRIICVEAHWLATLSLYCYSPGQGWRVSLRLSDDLDVRGIVVRIPAEAGPSVVPTQPPFQGVLRAVFGGGGLSGWGVTLSTLFNLHRV